MTPTKMNESRATTLIALLNRLNDAHKDDIVLESKNSLTIHILGADHREGNTGAETFTVFRSFTRHVANHTHISSLSFVLVGPNLARKLHLTRFIQKYCDPDMINTCDVVISYFVDSFETYFEDKTMYCKPDLVVCFNAGIWGYDEWLPTIKIVLNELCVPLLITSYNEHEAGDDEDTLDELMPAKWLWRPEQNQHGDTTLRATSNEHGWILRENEYWMCLSGRSM
ncbi:uncharacterized protein PHALS_02368 [Plasmopara halstedii]|uniref:Mitochondrial splicing suppressor 51-like C-terminal domain-containing protein n=1 Tax=Plasmopara halstedii TaxID=4781 RepID=A0A0P1AYZ6_PLAHL|nr:uncharacterized protein PHALS_02368 [Plasmopara halstedii]CEG46045.1 hypothetical protein PHALS_02368 [Plasmopara halstedii]|eukprot:XP_024582414.1 hypothetical protein PHALS_02368 [Plasmopara halstedii]